MEAIKPDNAPARVPDLPGNSSRSAREDLLRRGGMHAGMALRAQSPSASPSCSRCNLQRNISHRSTFRRHPAPTTGPPGVTSNANIMAILTLLIW